MLTVLGMRPLSLNAAKLAGDRETVIRTTEKDAGVVCDNTTVEEVSNNYCRNVNNGSCSDRKVCEQTEDFLLFGLGNHRNSEKLG